MGLPEKGDTICKAVKESCADTTRRAENGCQSINCLLVKIYVMYIFNLVSLNAILLYKCFYYLNLK